MLIQRALTILWLLTSLALAQEPSFNELSSPPQDPIESHNFDPEAEAPLAPELEFVETAQQAVERTSLQYFIDHTHPVTGIVRDKAKNFTVTPADNRMGSIAATGFGMAVFANAAVRGMISYDIARDNILRGLRFSRDHVSRYKGWFLHWMDWKTGARWGNSEYSPIDTALFIAGALYAAHALGDPEIHAITYKLYEEMDFHALMTNDGKRPGKRTLSMSYTPERGYTLWQWNMHGEQAILIILGLGHPTNPIPGQVWANWNRQYAAHPSRWGVMGYNMPLFVHQYSQLFLDFRSFNDRHTNYFHNATRVSHMHRRQRNRQGFWGLSAGEAPGHRYAVFNPTSRNRNTICVGCAPGSAMFMFQEVSDDVQAWRTGPYKDQVWGNYGLIDSLNIPSSWFSDTVIGITVGPQFLSFANVREDTSIWRVFSTIPAIQAGMQKASLVPRTNYVISF